ncbi:maleylpyruvate isomerase family mycothiol-dependent enzyme [Nonomuraea sp. NPDC001023]|uniref:maleylpyruvate isomerase family mycothiol-dependent enzyme n=1 Tax=unclassified Nonomuraea TaxID=2593643 RepID=UPI00332563F1
MTDPYLYGGPPPGLRTAVLSGARRRRAPAAGGVASVTVPYAEQVALMDDLLAELSPAQWDTPIARHGTVRDLVGHLTANDATVAAFMGLPGAGAAPEHRRWREQAGALLDRLSRAGEVLLGVEVALAGVRPARAPLRQALIQRTFETWTHADDIRAATGRPPAPPRAGHVRLIAGFGLALLPRALRGPRPDVSVTVVLTGPGGGTWTVPLSRTPGAGAGVISAGAVDFCRLVAGRWPPDTFPHASEGDRQLTRDLIRAAATLGCD